MLFKNSLKITVDNINLVFKILIYVFILLLVCMALFYAIIEPIFNDLFYEFDFSHELQETVIEWLDGDNTSFKSFLSEIGDFFNHRSQNLVISLVLFMLLYALLVLCIGIMSVPITAVIYDKLRESHNKKFLHAFIENIKSALVYAVVNVMISCVIDYLLMAFGVFLAELLFKTFGYVGLTMAVGIILAMFSLKITILSEWTAQIVCRKKGVFSALKDTIANLKKNIAKSYIPNLTTVLLLFTILMSTSLFTFGISLAIAVPMYIVMLGAIGVLTHLDNMGENFQI